MLKSSGIIMVIIKKTQWKSFHTAVQANYKIKKNEKSERSQRTNLACVT